MGISVDELKSYEAMAKLALPEPELLQIAKQANMLVESFQALERYDTKSVEPLVGVLELKNVMREDVAVKLLSRDELLTCALDEYDGYFQVPKTLE